MKRIGLLKKRQAMLKEQICENMDLLIGTNGRSPAMTYHNLTAKIDGKTISYHVGKNLVPKVVKMTQRNKEVHLLIHKLLKIVK